MKISTRIALLIVMLSCVLALYLVLRPTTQIVGNAATISQLENSDKNAIEMQLIGNGEGPLEKIYQALAGVATLIILTIKKSPKMDKEYHHEAE